MTEQLKYRIEVTFPGETVPHRRLFASEGEAGRFALAQSRAGNAVAALELTDGIWKPAASVESFLRSKAIKPVKVRDLQLKVALDTMIALLKASAMEAGKRQLSAQEKTTVIEDIMTCLKDAGFTSTDILPVVHSTFEQAGEPYGWREPVAVS